jgi:hypothetical protein
MQAFNRSTHLALILAFGAGLGAGTAAGQEAGKSVKGKALPVGPCCSITAIDKNEKTVTGRVTATEEAFTLKVADGALLARLKIGDTLDFKPDTSTGSTSTSATAAGGTTTKGNNSPRNADTRPKDCIATISSGAKIPVACPSNVPIKTSK